MFLTQMGDAHIFWLLFCSVKYICFGILLLVSVYLYVYFEKGLEKVELTIRFSLSPHPKFCFVVNKMPESNNVMSSDSGSQSLPSNSVLVNAELTPGNPIVTSENVGGNLQFPSNEYWRRDSLLTHLQALPFYGD